MKAIQPCIWFNGNGDEAAKYYTSVFKNSKIVSEMRHTESSAKINETAAGKVLTVDFELEGLKFMALNGGPMFKPTHAISFYVTCSTEAEINELWSKLKSKALMEIQEYPWSKRYGWCEDKYGVGWQLTLAPNCDDFPKISPALMFIHKNFGQLEAALKFYTSLFPNSKIDQIVPDEKTKTVLFSSFKLNGANFVAMENGLDHPFDFSEGLSLMVHCDDDKEHDLFWSKLSKHPENEQCGWCKDDYGVSWQIIPKGFLETMKEGDAGLRERRMAAMMEMKKLDVQALKAVT